MAQTLARAADASILRENPALRFRNGSYAYTIERGTYAVTDGKQTLAAPIAWAFGQGAAGQTYVIERNGKWYESRVSFYRKVGGLDLTLGARNAIPRNIEEAFGRQMTGKDAAACFGCHSYGPLASLTPGVQCESCHSGGSRHAAAIRGGDIKAAAVPKLGALTTEEISDLCGKCHRTWADIAANGPRGVENVRFQGYRLANSKCYDAADRRISCTACHDPHQEIERRSVAYDAKCQACHTRGCPTRKSDCAGCHMPKYEIPGSHHMFSDHQIRVVRANEPYPN